MNTTAGGFALLGAVVPSDAPVSAKLRKAGVIVIGKANLSQYANFKGNITNGCRYKSPELLLGCS
jgi:amidase